MGRREASDWPQAAQSLMHRRSERGGGPLEGLQTCESFLGEVRLQRWVVMKDGRSSVKWSSRHRENAGVVDLDVPAMSSRQHRQEMGHLSTIRCGREEEGRRDSMTGDRRHTSSGASSITRLPPRRKLEEPFIFPLPLRWDEQVLTFTLEHINMYTQVMKRGRIRLEHLVVVVVLV